MVSEFNIHFISKKENYFEIILVELKDVNDKSYMFYHCYELLEFIPYNEYNNNKEEYTIANPKKDNYSYYMYSTYGDYYYEEKTFNYSNIFNGYESLSFLPVLSKWYTCNCTNMSNMFNGCYSLKNLPDIFE